jgi:DNA invertase Pin-like site-specific DNA recombinase
MTPKKHSGNFVAYYRINSYRVVGQQLTVEEQQDHVRTYLNGGTWKLIAEYTEIEGTRATRRPVLQDAITLCQEQDATLIIANIDRLYRNAYFLSLVRDAKIKLLAVDNPDVDYTSIGILASIAERDGEKIKARTRAALQKVKAAGRKLGGPNLKEAAERSGEVVSIKADRFAEKVLPVIDKLRSQGLVTYREIANALNEMGIPTARGGEWFASTVRNAELRRNK